jgi:hypothetical protein
MQPSIIMSVRLRSGNRIDAKTALSSNASLVRDHSGRAVGASR